jgi:hypothetical protein
MRPAGFQRRDANIEEVEKAIYEVLKEVLWQILTHHNSQNG